LATEEEVLDALRQVNDPELGVNIVDLGLIYTIDITERRLQVSMTMTSPGCPLTGVLESEANDALHGAFPDLVSITLDIVWGPLWSPMMMSPAAKRQLGWSDQR